ncbi:unnamed protein product [Protopolystoma xenopodis]|uniref:Uncharacterized protein n=1 Tax=Protopolystoma xenopodis TaxID=117903 RepID=A0A448WZ71_9PLAT|nr:unnamed protein product [Protopolystoma xenopodis]
MPSIIEMTQASRGEPYTWNGSERWMADGDCHSPSAGELLANRSWLIRSLAGVLFAPATSLNRLKALDTRST